MAAVWAPPRVCNYSHRLHRNSPSSSRPPLLRSLPRCMCRAYASSHITNLTYLPHTLHRGLVVRFVIRPDLRFGPHPSFRSSSASVSYSANPAIISSARLYRAPWCLLSCTPTLTRSVIASHTTEHRRVRLTIDCKPDVTGDI